MSKNLDDLAPEHKLALLIIHKHDPKPVHAKALEREFHQLVKQYGSVGAAVTALTKALRR